MSIPSSVVIQYNGQEAEVTWYTKNKTSNRTGTNVVSTFTEPVAGLEYVSHVIEPGHGVYNTSLKKWTIANLYPAAEKRLKIKYRVTDISKLILTIAQNITLTETDDILDNNKRIFFFVKDGQTICNPDSFTTPAVQISDDNIYERVYIGDNDSIDCPCCEKEYTTVDHSSINVQVIGYIGNYANVIRMNPGIDSYWDYTATCTNCTDNNEYPAGVNATVKLNKLYSSPRTLKAILAQTTTGAPVANVNINTLGGSVTWIRVSDGKYRGTCTGAFELDNTHVYVTMPATSGKYANGSYESANAILIEVRDASGTLVDADVSGISLTIEVYPVMITPTPSKTSSVTPTVTVTPSITPTPVTPSITPSITLTPSITPSISISASITPTISLSPTTTPSITISKSVTPSITISSSVTPSISVSLTATPSITISVSITPSISITPTVTPSH
jgi:Domain of unknown function DUF11